MRIKNCVNCGKAPVRDYKQEKLKAIEHGDFDHEGFREHLYKIGQPQRDPKGKEWDHFATSKSTFPAWPSTNLQVISEHRPYLTVKYRFVWDGESYRNWSCGGGHFCTNRCAIKYATKVANQMEREENEERAFAASVVKTIIGARI